jgi:hypothetical protein
MSTPASPGRLHKSNCPAAGQSGEASKVRALPPAFAGAGRGAKPLALLASPDCPGRGAGGAVAAAPEAFEAAARGAVEGRRRSGIRCKGSIWDGLNGAVAPGFASGSRFEGSVRNGLNGAVGRGFAVVSRFKGSVRNGLNGAVEPGFAVGARFKGSVRNGLNGAVGRGFAAGSRFKGSVRNGLNGAVGRGFAVGSRFEGSVRNGLNGETGPDVGAPCDGRMAGARRPTARAASSDSRRLSPVQGAIGTGEGTGGLSWVLGRAMGASVSVAGAAGLLAPHSRPAWRAWLRARRGAAQVICLVWAAITAALPAVLAGTGRPACAGWCISRHAGGSGGVGCVTGGRHGLPARFFLLRRN